MQTYNFPNWHLTRPAYEQFVQAKREHKKAVRRLNTSEIEVMIAAKRVLKTTISETMDKAIAAIMEAIFDEETIAEIVLDETKIGEFPAFFLRAKDGYNASLENLNETLQTLENTEKAYLTTVFKVLRDAYGLNISEIADAFGIWNGTLMNWISASEEEESNPEVTD